MATHKQKQNNRLTRKEQSTTTAYKMMSEKINNLEGSLKKTQDGSETIRIEKDSIEKKYIILEEKLKDRPLIIFLEFLSSAGLGFAASYLSDKNWQMAASIGIPCMAIYIICLYLTKR